MSRSAVVVGAGVVGLTTAVCLAEDGWEVTIVAAESPQQTTSRAAAAMWGSAFVGPPEAVPRWAGMTLDVLRDLAADPSSSGVRMTAGTLVSPREDLPPPPELFPGIEMRPLDVVPAGYALAVEVVVPLVDMPVYLDYLLARVEAAGGVLELRRLSGLDEVAGEFPVVVNCAGVGAGALVGDPSVRPSRGQHVIVENPGIDRFFMEPPLGGAWAAWHPHPDYVVMGGVAVGDDWNMEPDPEVAEQIVARCAAIEPRLGTARVLEHRVGLRPERAAVRLEAEGSVIHNYGHGGSGVSLSWGCARDVQALVAQK